MKILTKRLLIVLSALLFVTVLAACQGFTTTGGLTSSTPTNTNSDNTAPTITIPTPIVDSPSVDSDTRELGVNIDDRITIDNDNREFSFHSGRIYTDERENSVIGTTFVQGAGGTEFIGTWTPTIVTPGYYKIYLTWPEIVNASESVEIQIDYEGGANRDATKTLDQTENCGLWVFVGTYYLTAGSANSVSILGNGEGEVLADAARFELSAAVTALQEEETLQAAEPFVPGSIVKIVKTHQEVLTLTVDGELFFVKGICGTDELDLLAEAGGNAARTYSIDNLQNGAVLDLAQSLGIKIIIGLWMNHEGGGFTYANSPEVVQAQYESLILAIDQYKTHPALLGWAVGNEVDISTSAQPQAIYAAINDLAKYIHENDPYHPTMAVLAGSSPLKIGSIGRYSPHIDIMGINTYSAIGNAQTNLMGWRGPSMITEYALNQPSETKIKTSWGAIIEPTSLEKADLYYSRYQSYIDGEKENGIIGSFVFKDTGSFRVTHTWYGIVQQGLRTPQYYAMKAAWNGTDRMESPSITSVTIDGKTVLENTQVEADTPYDVIVETTGTEGKTVVYSYEVRKETPISSNTVPSPLPEFVFSPTTDANRTMLTMSNKPGYYRLFVYVKVNDIDISTFSFPFQVTGDIFVLEDQPGAKVIPCNSTLGYLETGVFGTSSNRFYQTIQTRFTREYGAYASFYPKIDVAGTYEVFFYNLSEGMGQTDDPELEIQVQLASGIIETFILNVTTLPSGWVSLGEFAFDGSKAEVVQVTKSASGTKVTRSTAVACVPVN